MKRNPNGMLRSPLVLTACLALLVGCGTSSTVLEVHQDLARRGLHGPRALKHLDPGHRGTIADNYRIGGAEVHKGVEGTGVVVGLNETGDMTGLDLERRQLALKRLVTIEDPEFKCERGYRLNRVVATRWMNSGYVSLVLVRAVVGVGQRAGDRLDVFVSTLDGAQSLEGGYLFPTELKPFATGLNPEHPTEKKYGSTFVEAAGAVVIPPGRDGRSNVDLRRGQVEAGGRVVVQRDRLSVLNVMLAKPDGRDAVFLEHLLNRRFSGKAGRATPLGPVARAVKNNRVSIRIPDHYDADPLRFVAVITRMPARLLKDSHAKSLARKNVRHLLDPDARQRMLGALILEGLAAPHGTRELQSMLQTGPTLARIEAGRALYFLGYDDALEIARDLVLSGAVQERIEALTLYTLFDREAPLDVMRSALDVDNEQVAAVAAFTLALCGDAVPVGRRLPGRVIDLRVNRSPSSNTPSVGADETYRVLWVPHASRQAVVSVRMNEKRAIVFLGKCPIEGSFHVEFQRFTLTVGDPGRVEVRFKQEGKEKVSIWNAEATQVAARLEFLGLSWSDNVRVLKEIGTQRAMTAPVSHVVLAGNKTEDRLARAMLSADR